MNRAILAALVLPLAACDDNRGHSCNLIGCNSGAQFELAPVPESDFARLTGARMEVCFLGNCKVRVIDVLPSPNDILYMDLGSPGEPRVEVSLWRTNPSGVIEILVVIASDDHELFHDGDVYTVALVGADGGRIVDQGWSVTYRTWQPNGPECEPTCRSALTTTEL